METPSVARAAGSPEDNGWIRTNAAALLRMVDDLSLAEKGYGTVGLLVIFTAFLLVMSVQSVRLQISYRHLQAASASAAINIGRVNGLIYAIVMESRGIYMSSDRGTIRAYGNELLKRNSELAEVMGSWQAPAGADDAVQFAAFKKRIEQFMDFREELVRRAVEIGPAAGRAWGDNDANRALRTQLNVDLEALAKIYDGRAREAVELGDTSRYAAWYLFGLGLGTLAFAALNLWIMKRSVIGPLREIIRATDRVAEGNLNFDIPHISRGDEIGSLARAVRNFRDAVARNLELKQLELDTARQRDAVIEERDRYNDNYLEKKWQLSAAIHSIPQGIIMFDAKAVVLAINGAYRRMYSLPATIKSGSTLDELVQCLVENGLFTGNVAKHLAAMTARIAKRQPLSEERVLVDDRVIRVEERPVDGGGWMALHEDVSDMRKRERILQRTEQFLATIIENVPEAIVAKDARNLRYVFVNKAAEVMIGKPRGEIMGKTARELFSAEMADMIEGRDRQLIAQKQQLDPIVDSVDNPAGGKRTVAVRRLQVGGPDRESHLFVSMIEDRTTAA
jgi:PAS domain S-box-containing protein